MLKAESKKEQIVLIIIHTSIGELQWILPFAHSFKEQGFKVCTVFFSDRVFESIKEEGVYYRLLEDCSTIVQKKSLFGFLWRNGSQVRYIFKDFWPIHQGSLANKIRQVCTNAALILFPHSFALYGYDQRVDNFVYDPKSHDQACYDLLVLNSKYDISYWSSRIMHDRIKVVGALGYHIEWVEKVIDSANAIDRPEAQIVNEGKLNILFAIRGPKPILLEEENYHYLMDTALEELFTIPNAFVLIKPHPRQNFEDLKKKLSNYPNDRYSFVYSNPFVLSRKVDFAVNFWTSVTTDLLSQKIPSIEYYKFEGGYTKWFTYEDGSRTSYYNILDLTNTATNQKELNEALSQMMSNIEQVKAERFKRFNEVFENSGSAAEVMLQTLKETKRTNNVSLAQRFQAFVQVFYSSIKSSLN
ncbi:hypothetical protein [Roseivirga misakiensis]|uniref:Uncharacterized protein n=1 Tax=Roseivirga misakiensis TaxID=1563681 RepID=A0A1E5T1E9_9BACT|nr:hypothetical protein [Roseivirga misakiensis]OEK05208.1 hypothetical protein BFP71_17545 [Roseivirga misakiensis]